MPILDIQSRDREVGRLRLGERVPTANGKTRPTADGKLRLTSPDRQLLEQCAQVYGGRPTPWNDQWQLKIEADEIDILATFLDPSQWYEHWDRVDYEVNGKKTYRVECIHRCDGVHDVKTDSACSCDPENRLCKPVTRITFFLPKLASLGVWRLETRSINAARELPNAVQYLQKARSLGIPVPATVALEKRSRSKQGITKNFVVPVLRLRITLEDLMGQIAGGGDSRVLQNSAAAPLPSQAAAALNAKSAPALESRSDKPSGLADRMRDLGWAAVSAKPAFKRIKTVAAFFGIDWQELVERALENGYEDITEAADWAEHLDIDRPESAAAEPEDAQTDNAEPEDDPDFDPEEILDDAFGDEK